MSKTPSPNLSFRTRSLLPAFLESVYLRSEGETWAGFYKRRTAPVTLGTPKTVRFFRVQPDGSLVAEARSPVAPKSRNFRFELAAARGIPYPEKGVPIGLFKRVADSDFHYVLLLPGNPGHQLVTNFLDDLYPKKTRVLRRVQITMGDLQKIWPDAPFFL